MRSIFSLNDTDGENEFSIISYGVTIKVRCAPSLSPELAELATKAFPNDFAFISTSGDVDHTFTIKEQGSQFLLTRDSDEPILGLSKDTVLELFIRMSRLMVSEGAKNHVFLHAGVVAIDNKVVVIPGSSGSGKTSLILALIKLGAIYYSDEYAVIDKNGMVHPFARELSVKSEGKAWSEKDGVSPQSLGAQTGQVELPVGLVLFTEFSPSAVSKFEPMSLGQGILSAIPHTITFSKRPDFSLGLLKCAFSRAIILCGLRGESDLSAKLILSLS